jgi:hypothetical protein
MPLSCCRGGKEPPASGREEELAREEDLESTWLCAAWIARPRLEGAWSVREAEPCKE